MAQVFKRVTPIAASPPHMAERLRLSGEPWLFVRGYASDIGRRSRKIILQHTAAKPLQDHRLTLVLDS
jgi:hypothetical protein